MMPGNQIGKKPHRRCKCLGINFSCSCLSCVLYHFAGATRVCLSIQTVHVAMQVRDYSSSSSPNGGGPGGRSLSPTQSLFADELVDVCGVVVFGDTSREVAVIAFQLQGRHWSWAAGWDEARARGLGDGDAGLLAWREEEHGVLHIRVLAVIGTWREGWLRAVGTRRGRGCRAGALGGEVGWVEAWQRGHPEGGSTA